MTLPKLQPAVYSELKTPEPRIGKRGLSEPAAPNLQLPYCADACRVCEHHEPFAANLFVVWCSLHGGHVPGGATCDDYLWPSEPS